MSKFILVLISFLSLSFPSFAADQTKTPSGATSSTKQIVKPEDILSDSTDITEIRGVMVRKGTIAAFFKNSIIYSNASSTSAEKEAAKKMLIEYAPAIIALEVNEVVTFKDPNIQKIIDDAAAKFNQNKSKQK